MYYTITEGQLVGSEQPVAEARPFLEQVPQLLPHRVGALHQAFRAWGDLALSPGTMHHSTVWWGTPSNALADDAVALAFRFERGKPVAQGPRGVARDLAAWLMLLNSRVETFVVVARARAVWTPTELSGALSFITPAFLPKALITDGTDDWSHLAAALSVAVADGPLKGQPQNHHWTTS